WAGARAGHRRAGGSYRRQDLRDAFQGGSGRRVGVINVRVQFDRDPAIVPCGTDCPQGGGKVDGPLAGDEVMMDTRDGDVFQVVVSGESRQPRHRRRRVVADTVEVADVEVEPDCRRIKVLHQFEELIGSLDEQIRLRFYQKQYALLLGV